MPDATEIPKVQKITVSGRTFVPYEETTIEQDQYIALILEESGLSKLRNFNPLTDDFTEASRLLVLHAFATGKLFALLGAMLTEDPNEDFSMEAVKRREDFLRHLKRKVDKDALRGAIVALILSFFVSGAWFVKHSEKYSLSAATDPMKETRTTEEIIGAVLDTITASGTTS